MSSWAMTPSRSSTLGARRIDPNSPARDLEVEGPIRIASCVKPVTRQGEADVLALRGPDLFRPVLLRCERDNDLRGARLGRPGRAGLVAEDNLPVHAAGPCSGSAQRARPRRRVLAGCLRRRGQSAGQPQIAAGDHQETAARRSPPRHRWVRKKSRPHSDRRPVRPALQRWAARHGERKPRRDGRPAAAHRPRARAAAPTCRTLSRSRTGACAAWVGSCIGRTGDARWVFSTRVQHAMTRRPATAAR